MIEWMQTHRRWLVITIWVATIAFIGAGFVGWGQFQFGRKQSVIATVKNTEVTVQDVQNEYNLLFQQFNQQLGGKLDEATAKKLGLDKLAIQKAIQKGILRQYAKDLGLYVTDKELAEYILKIFGSKKNYEIYLKNSGETAENFEKNLRKQLLVEKMLSLLNIKPSETETLSVASALYNSDNIVIKILKKSNIKVDLSEDEIKNYYKKHKNQFLSKEKYKIAYVKIPLEVKASKEELKKYYETNKLKYKNEKGEILSFEKALNLLKKDFAAEKLRKKAVLAYKKLKANKENYKITILNKNNNLIPNDKMQKLIKEGYIKPFVYNNAYISAKLIEEIKPKPLPFEKAKYKVIEILLNKKAEEKLMNLSKNTLNNFEGINIGFVTKFDVNKIKNLTPEKATLFLQKLFISHNPKGFVLIPQNSPEISILYKIKEQKLLDEQKYKKNKQQVYLLTQNMLSMELINDLINELEQKYSIKVYIK